VVEITEIWPVKILKVSDLKARTGAILDRAKRAPIYIERNGTLLVITKAGPVTETSNSPLSPFNLRAKTIESFYDSAKTW
jgi:hypothetical protein